MGARGNHESYHHLLPRHHCVRAYMHEITHDSILWIVRSRSRISNNKAVVMMCCCVSITWYIKKKGESGGNLTA